MTIDAAQLRREIEDAFAAVPYPGDNSIVEHKCWECDLIATKYKGKRWTDYKDCPLELIGPPISDAFPLFTPAAFRHYAPLAMLAAAESYMKADTLTEQFLRGIEPAQDDFTARRAARLAAFAPNELRALLSFLRFMKDNHPLDFNAGPSMFDVASLEKAIKTRLEGMEMRGENAPPRSKE
ncbi:MAG: hypothetical protein HKL90_13795 [Elusimicrobia bacterium]|nr:hypothetical protein [Elusimicrobiota bacterium]